MRFHQEHRDGCPTTGTRLRVTYAAWIKQMLELPLAGKWSNLEGHKQLGCCVCLPTCTGHCAVVSHLTGIREQVICSILYAQVTLYLNA